MGGGYVSQSSRRFVWLGRGSANASLEGAWMTIRIAFKSSISATEMTSRGLQVSLSGSSKRFAVRDMKKRNRWCD